MKIYIIGKVTGTLLHECTMKFGFTQVLIEKQGHTAINPLAVVNDWKTPWDIAMRKCITALMTADAVYALPCSQNSKGAKIELELAKQLNIPVYLNLKQLMTNKQ